MENGVRWKVVKGRERVVKPRFPLPNTLNWEYRDKGEENENDEEKKIIKT